jgi:nucleotide-binding universal stress UspA family protein
MTNVNDGAHPAERGSGSEFPVVVGVDGSEPALHAVRWAAREADRQAAVLRLVHVCYLAPVRHPKQVAPPQEYQTAVLEQGRHWLSEAVAAARQVAPGITIITDLHSGVVAHELITESRQARQLVLGSRGLGGFRSLLVGSIAVALSGHAHCPVAVIRSSTSDGVPPSAGPVVVGVDGSALSDAALEYAFEAAAARTVPLLVVHAWADVDVSGAWAAAPGTIDWDWLQAEEEKELAEQLAPWQDRYPDVEVRPVVARGRPAHTLLEHAADAQLVVVGSRGRGALAGLGLGSVSQTLLHQAECPVVVARTER